MTDSGKEQCMDRRPSPIITFVIPVYNVERYIRDCAMSILRQNVADIEAIFIDDGSPDKSGVILDEIARQDERVAVIHKENGGVSSARNAGMQVAKGEYVIFVDGDDYLEPDHASYLLDLISTYRCDMALSQNHFSIDQNAQIDRDVKTLESNTFIMKGIYEERINVAVWNKIYKRSFLEKNRLYFNQSVWFGEGMLFNIECLQCTQNVAVGQRRTYHQVFNTESAMRSFRLENMYCGMRSLDMQRTAWRRQTSELNNAWAYHYFSLYFIALKGLIETQQANDHQAEYKRFKKKIQALLPRALTADVPLKRKITALLSAVMPEIWAKRCILKERRYYTMAYEMNPTVNTVQKGRGGGNTPSN